MIFLLACADPEPGLDANPAWLACTAEPVPELKVGCMVDVAAGAGRVGDAALAERACAEVPADRWQGECWFRCGEEAGRAGHTELALRACGRAGEFSRFCLTHAGWGLPPDARGIEWWLDIARRELPEALQTEAADVLRARWWFNHYVGSGAADPASAKAAVDEAPYARGAWAIECLRLRGTTDVPGCRAVWAGGVPPTGAPVASPVGRYDLGAPIPGESELPHVHTFGDARRLVGADEAEDVEIALIEAIYFLGTPSGGEFEPWLNDPRPRVRYTALRLFRILPSSHPAETLGAFAADPDPVVRAHVADALAYQTWLGPARR